MSDTQPLTTYTAEASAADAALDATLAAISAAQDRHELTPREAADLRITALESHLAEIRALRVKYFGTGPYTTDDEDLPAPNFYPADGPSYGETGA